MAKKYAYGVCLYKIDNNDIKILLCKSVKSLNKWGCLKGVKNSGENALECAKREFFEECNINVEISDFEEFFDQNNLEKDIGVWLVNANKVSNLDSYFLDEKLLDNNLSWENSKVKFFSIYKLPKIRAKQVKLISKITDFLRNKHQLRLQYH
ncbi:NUDIX domain-containing protein [Arcobacter sp.]|uniref:NUDIX domain-containing protein n=1 Tax=Arcobacter sp. TaxID=1872629 RepID=UPI003D0ACBE5